MYPSNGGPSGKNESLWTMFGISQVKVGEEIGDGSSMRKYCAICETYFGLSVEEKRCPCSKNVLVVEHFSPPSVWARIKP